MCPQNLLPSRARDPVQSDARWIRESATPAAIHLKLSSPFPLGIDPPGATRLPPPPRAGRSPPISSLRSAHTHGSAIARQKSSDRTASESPNRQTHTPYILHRSNILSD